MSYSRACSRSEDSKQASLSARSIAAFSFDANLIEDAFRQGAKALVLCNPSNPCGKVFSREELQTIADIVIRYDGYVITDEVYEHIVYAPHKHVYISTLPGMWERTISCSSLSKTYSITGWRLGYVIAPEHIIERVKKVHDFLTVGAAAPLMEAATVGLCFPDSYYEGLQAHYAHMKHLFCDGLRQFGLEFTDPEGAYYVMLDVSKYGVRDDLHFCEWLAEHVGVGAVPGSCFFKEDVHHLIRFHFAKRDETLLAALDRLSELDVKARNNYR
jgi:aminotransferase